MREDKEYQLAKAVSTYLKLQYPDVIFHFDYAGLKLTKTQAGKMKAIQGERGWPDLFIAEKRNRIDSSTPYNGLFIELKIAGTKLFKRNGSYATPHIAEQSKMLVLLSEKGYKCRFGIGFDDVKMIIDEYLNS